MNPAFNESIQNCTNSMNMTTTFDLPFLRTIRDYYCLALAYADHFEFNLSHLNFLEVSLIQLMLYNI